MSELVQNILVVLAVSLAFIISGLIIFYIISQPPEDL